MIYDNLNDSEVRNIAHASFGDTLKSVAEIGKDAVVEELRVLDAIG